MISGSPSNRGKGKIGYKKVAKTKAKEEGDNSRDSTERKKKMKILSNLQALDSLTYT